jgi:dethiobiotin synthetase
LTAVFIAGAHTDVGKTHVACALIHAARGRGLAVDAFKPIVSGFDPRDWAGSDPGRLLAALGRDPTPEALAAISPWRFAAPLAPPMAARLEGVRLEAGPVAHACRAWLSGHHAGLRLVEGVGGLMSPLAESATGLDLMCLLGLPAILVGGSYLGAISHTLTAVETLRAHRLPLAAVVVSEAADADAPDFAASLDLVREHAGEAAVLPAPRDRVANWAVDLLDVVMSAKA